MIKTARNKYVKSRKFLGECENCKQKISIDKSYCYVDDTCASQNYYSKYLCLDCYLKIHKN